MPARLATSSVEVPWRPFSANSTVAASKIDARRSSAEDARLAESISAMTQADAAHRAALGALANAGRLSLMDYLK